MHSDYSLNSERDIEIDPVFEILQQSAAIRLVTEHDAHKIKSSSDHGNLSKPKVRFLKSGVSNNAMKCLVENDIPYVVLYAYSARQSNDLPLKRGSIVTVENSKDLNWWYGKDLINGRQGYFPADFIMKISPTDQIFEVHRQHQGYRTRNELTVRPGKIFVCSCTQLRSDMNSGVYFFLGETRLKFNHLTRNF